jgi:hypothetical protein
VLTIRFPGIQLPDSIANEPASHGFVQFRLKQMPGLPDKTMIRNRAGIFFDLNPVVLTNTCFHTVSAFLLLTATQDHIPGALSLEVFPNPSERDIRFRLNDNNLQGTTTMTLYDLTGKILRNNQFSGTEFLFDGLGLQPGIYMFRLLNTNGKTATGKIMLR